jgi:hypothetical protein
LVLDGRRRFASTSPGVFHSPVGARRYEGSMQTAVTILSWVLANAPDPTTTGPPPPPTRVDVEHTDDSIHVLAYDAEGDVTAEVVEWWNGADIRIDANFPDGVYLSATVRAEDDVTIESNDPAAVSERNEKIPDDAECFE